MLTLMIEVYDDWTRRGRADHVSHFKVKGASVGKTLAVITYWDEKEVESHVTVLELSCSTYKVRTFRQ